VFPVGKNCGRDDPGEKKAPKGKLKFMLARIEEAQGTMEEFRYV
jgi:hypothetical protein